MEQTAKKIYRFLSGHKILLWSIFSICIAVSIIGATRLRFTEDISDFFPRNAEFERLNNAYTHLGGENTVVIIIENVSDNADMSNVELAVDIMEQALYDSDTLGVIKNITAHVDDSQVADIACFVASNMPFFLDSTDYSRMDTIITPDKIRAALENDRIILSSPLGSARAIIQTDPLHFAGPAMEKLEEFKASDKFKRIGDYIYSQDSAKCIVVVTSAYPVGETMNNGKLLSIIDNCAASASQQLDNAVKIDSFGAVAVAHTNASQIKKDSIKAIAIALVIIIILLLYYYRNVRSVVMIAVSILCGAVFAIGLLSIIKSDVSIIALGVASIIMGLAVNYPIHILSAFKDNPDKISIIETVVKPMVVGNITTVGAFISLLFISSPAMKDLGLTAAMLLVGTIIFVVVFLPHMLGKGNTANSDLAFGKAVSLQLDRIRFVMPCVIVLSIVFYCFAGKTGFDTDMHHINYMTAEQSAYFQEFATDTDTSRTTLYCVAYGNNTEHALMLQNKAEKSICKLVGQGLIETKSGIGNFIPDTILQKEKIAMWNAFLEKNGQQLQNNLTSIATDLGFSKKAFSSFLDLLQNPVNIQDEEYFESAMEQMCSNYLYKDNNNTIVYNILSVNNANVSKVQQELDSVDPDIFTFADKSIAARMSGALSQDFDLVLYVCGFLVFTFLLISFGRIELALIAFAPLALAWIWILGIMGMTGIQFNIVNIILATFIFGQGDDYSIFVTEGLMYEYATGKKRLAFYKNSILLSALIMFAGIGTLILGKHPAMRSLAQVTIIGMFSVVLMAYVVPPFLFRMLVQKKGYLRRIPVTLTDILKTVYVFTVFIISTIILDIAGLFLQHTLAYHKLLCNSFRILAKAMPGVTFNINQDRDGAFDKPSIITCNHQSHLDLMYTLLLNPKIIVLTNKWVWNCPFYGWIIRMADYLPVSNGLDAVMPRIRKMVDKGYSVLVFPEGSRSADCTISHFYQGAFHLAKELGLNVRPVILHGVGHVFAKKEFVLQKGSIDITILPEIEISEEKSALSWAHTTEILYRNEFEKICRRTENCLYFRNFVMRTYMYKGAEVLRSVRNTFAKTNLEELQQELEQIPAGSSQQLECDSYGEIALLSALVRPDVTFYVTLKNKENISIAATSANNRDNLHIKTD
ncbi:MAG: 1-acyl-sn-glycerol-3-phosphate acyltransferase [Bacteroidaceae bacterium]|nr:1-acyl-sn-glycerol-3-phosphate acyltransferase [Bacteroidaceae bacterium]